MGAYLRVRKGFLVLLCAALLALLVWRASKLAYARQTPIKALQELLHAEGLSLSENEPYGVQWFEERVVFLAQKEASLPDVYVAHARLTPNRSVVGFGHIRNVTSTPRTAERHMHRIGSHVLFASRANGVYEAVTRLDMRGESPALTKGWSRLSLLQNAITNFQETGALAGIGRDRFVFNEPERFLQLSTDGDCFSVKAPDWRERICERGLESDSSSLVRSENYKAQPGKITWLVDSIRNLSFVGPAPIEWLEHRVFTLKDAIQRLRYAVFGDDTAGDIADDLGLATNRKRIDFDSQGLETGLPPAPLKPVYRPTLKGEGMWSPVTSTDFLKRYPGTPPAFYRSFLRTDKDRPFARVYIVLFDPRLLQLHFMTGAREPRSASGETGTGMIPRKPGHLQSVVAGFNGGFQALHGEFGVMSGGKVYLPPKPWAATVGIYENGRVAMGSWSPAPEGVTVYDPKWAIAQIPEGMVAYRQNLSSMVEDGEYNPWKRWWWGAAPLNAKEQTLIDRSGLCLTKEGFLAYFWGRSLGPESLGRAMLRARCVRAMHLDMNLPHTGFEFYHVRPEKKPHKPLKRALRDDEYSGPLPKAHGYVLRAKKAVKSMQPIRFPRYISRDARDFFYLTLRKVLPGPDLKPPAAYGSSAKAFSGEGLPQVGWPPVFARTSLPSLANKESDLSGITLLRMDPHRLYREEDITRHAEFKTSPVAVLTNPSVSQGQASLWFDKATGGAHVGPPPPADKAKGRYDIWLRGTFLQGEPTAPAAIGVDRDGFLVYAERRGKGPGDNLLPVVRAAGVSRALALPSEVRWLFRKGPLTVDVAGYQAPLTVTSGDIRVVAAAPKHTEVLFPGNTPQPYGVWARLQDSRVRYQLSGPKRFSRFNSDSDSADSDKKGQNGDSATSKPSK